MKKPKYGEAVLEYKGYVIRFFEKGFLAIPKKVELIHAFSTKTEYPTGNRFELAIQALIDEIDILTKNVKKK